MDKNLASENIHVFPFGTTREKDKLARVLNEQNLTTIVRNMTDYPNYVLRYDIITSTMDFVIQGYYFSAKISTLKEANKPLYAYISITTDSSGYQYLAGGDDSEGNFTGVTFTSSEPANTNFSIKLLNSDGSVPKESLVRMSADSLPANASFDFDVINCGSATTVIEDIQTN